MTDEQREILLGRLLERPESLSEAEIAEVLADDELRDLYALSTDLQGALWQPKQGLEDEWERFRKQVQRPRRVRRPGWRGFAWTASAAALLAGALLVSQSDRAGRAEEMLPGAEAPLPMLTAEQNEALEQYLRVQRARVDQAMMQQWMTYSLSLCGQEPFSEMQCNIMTSI